MLGRAGARTNGEIRARYEPGGYPPVVCRDNGCACSVLFPFIGVIPLPWIGLLGRSGRGNGTPRRGKHSRRAAGAAMQFGFSACAGFSHRSEPRFRPILCNFRLPPREWDLRLSGFRITHPDPLAETPAPAPLDLSARSPPICESESSLYGRPHGIAETRDGSRSSAPARLFHPADLVGRRGRRTRRLEAYKSRPGDAGQAPAVFPHEFPQGESDSDWQSTSRRSRPRLIMFVHPQCPCTKASLGQLAEILAHHSGKADAAVVFVKPAGAGPDWDQTSLRAGRRNSPGPLDRRRRHARAPLWRRDVWLCGAVRRRRQTAL